MTSGVADPSSLLSHGTATGVRPPELSVAFTSAVPRAAARALVGSSPSTTTFSRGALPTQLLLCAERSRGELATERGRRVPMSKDVRQLLSREELDASRGRI